MIQQVEDFKQLFTEHFEIDDMQAVDIVVAAAVSHKIPLSEMLWLRIIGASGTGKTELLRTIAEQEGYSTTMESITPGAIRRGYSFKRDKDIQKPLLERLDGKLVITKEFAVILTKDLDTQKEIFGLLRGVHDGELDADYGSEEGHLHQETKFDWILGTTQFVERQRQLEQLLGSRFMDLRWGRPIEEGVAVDKAVYNDGNLTAIRIKLKEAMTDIILNTVAYPKPKLEYLAPLANLAAMLRTPVERNTRTNEIYDIPDIELGTRFGQAISRLARGLLMIGVPISELKPYLVRLVMDCMSKKRAVIIRAWLEGLQKQQDIADAAKMSVAYVNRTIEDLRLLGWVDSKLELLKGQND
ncbi:ATP-binding protein [Patescibacteria group bacterium]|nr:ATP-binding protein [Patescibacteria group bacterium]